MQVLMSMPQRMSQRFADLAPPRMREWFVTHDPPGVPLGSAGGTAWLLAEAWRKTGGEDFSSWLARSPKLITHSGGQSRRLPAYAATGKALIPIPVFRWASGQRLDQTLIDLQMPDYQRLLELAPDSYRVLLSSGDVMIKFSHRLPEMPSVDVLALGLWVAPEQAQHFGVFFCPRSEPDRLEFFLQKPPADRVKELAGNYRFLVDTGIWLLSARAVNVLMKKCGWQNDGFPGGMPKEYELYAGFGLGLGRTPTQEDADINALTSAVMPLPDGEFYHFGTSRDLIESVTSLQRRVLDQSKLGLATIEARLNQHTQNSSIELSIKPENQSLWIENCTIPETWTLQQDHVLTGIPANDWELTLPAGVSLDLAPVGETAWCCRPYGMDDPFRGAIGDPATVFLQGSLQAWLEDRSLAVRDLGDPELDIQTAPLFPVLEPDDLTDEFMRWLLTAPASAGSGCAEAWRQSRRLSAREICQKVNLNRLFHSRQDKIRAVIRPMMRRHKTSVFHALDLRATAEFYVDRDFPEPLPETEDPLKCGRDEMFRAQVLRQGGDPEAAAHEDRAFGVLRHALLKQLATPVTPRRSVLPDQIIWGRSPVRLDVAGGWTDTPPYCLQYGGKVVNLAVNLNGQPPIQVFARCCETPEIVLRSIDLGVEERLVSYDDIADYARVGSGFSIGRAALALAGFLPSFAEKEYPDLTSQLTAFGGGIELSLVAAVPKGSGLGTSSILAATILGVLNQLCDLAWDPTELVQRTLVLEQMLTSGGGWQDQAGGIFRGVKQIHTQPGLDQTPDVRFLPEHLFGPNHLNQDILLYYTGITRVAKDILHEIVRGMFLNDGDHVRLLGDIAANADAACEAIARQNFDLLAEVVRRSWELNQALDRGTNPPAVEQISGRIEPYIRGLKLLGAGGGGYMLIFAKDREAGAQIRNTLSENPSTPSGRFVDLSLSTSGLEVTRS